MTCRICLEECDEKTTCACKGFVHAECQQRWMRVSKRDDCEICHTPFYTYVVCAPTCTCAHPYGLRCGDDDADNALFAAMICSVSVIYFTMLIFFKSWQMVLFVATACRVISIIWLIPLRYEVYIENVWMWWQFANCIIVALAYILTYTFPMADSTLRTRQYVLYLEMFLLVVTLVDRWLVGMCRASIQHRYSTNPDTMDTLHDP